MRLRPLFAAGMGMAAAVAFTAAASPALAAGGTTDPSALDVSGNQLGGLVGAYDDQGGLQLAGGQILYGQGNLNPDPKVLSPGDIGDVAQNDSARGAASNTGAASQTGASATDQSQGLVGIVGNQVGGLVEVADDQVLGQAAVGQLGILQANANAPVRVLSPGDNGNVEQGNGATGTAANQGGAARSVAPGAASGSLVGIVGNQVAGVVGLDDSQLLGQIAGGQVALVQLNANTPIRVVSPGSDGDVSQSNSAGGDASNAAAASQANPDATGDGLLGIVGVTVVSVDGTAVGAQGATGQLAVVQVNLDLPLNVLSPGAEGTLTQSNQGGGTGDNSGGAA